MKSGARVREHGEACLLESTEAAIRISPFSAGVSTLEHVIVRRDDAPRYLCLARAEYEALCALLNEPMSPRAFLARHLTGSHGLSFQEAVRLLMRLTEERFLLDMPAGLSDLMQEFSAKTCSHAEGYLRRLSRLASTLLDFPLVSFDDADVHPVLRRMGSFIGSVPALCLSGLTLIGLVYSSGFWISPAQTGFVELLAAPEELVLKIFLSFSLAASWLGLLQMATLAGAGARFVRGSVHVTGLCVVRLVTLDDDAFMLSKGKLARYQVFTLLSPWVFSLLSFQFVHGSSLGSFGGTLAAAFAIMGAFMLCPLFRSPLVKIAEGFLATWSVLTQTQTYLAKQMLSPLQKKSTASRKKAAGDRQTDVWIIGLVSVAMVWLYGVGLAFADVLLASALDLVMHVQVYERPFRALSAGILLVGLVFAVLAPLLRLVAIPLQNLWAVAEMPLRKVRRSVESFRSQAVTADEAVLSYLKTIAILGHLELDDLRALVPLMRFRGFARGYDIVKQGEEGDRFFILAAGRAQVIIEKPSGDQIVDVLQPGDSFGEIALLEQGRRTATIRALDDTKVLMITKADFDRLFPEESSIRASLTQLIRQTKLVADSDALSHLSPRQTRELLAHADSINVQAGTTLIREGEAGDACYLVEEGTLTVSREGGVLATLERGSLVGAIALIKDIERTATVTVMSDARLIKIGRESFLNMCMANVFVASLITNLTEEQLAAHNVRAS